MRRRPAVIGTLAVALATAATFVVVSVGGQAVGGQGVAQAKECGRPHGPLVAYGHSYVLSPGLGGATASYPTLAAAALHVKPVIRAVNGGTTQNVATLVRQGSTRWTPGTSDLVLIDSAINDIKNKVPTERWTASLRQILSTLATAPVPTILLVRPLPVLAPTHPGHDPKVIAAYAAAQREVAQRFSAVRIVDASRGWDPRVDLSTDGIHPTPAGELHLSKAVRTAAQRALCSP